MQARSKLVLLLSLLLVGCSAAGSTAKLTGDGSAAVGWKDESETIYVQQDENENGNRGANQRTRRGRSNTPGETEKNHSAVLESFQSLTGSVAKATVICLVDDKTVCRGTIVDPSGLVITKNSMLDETKELRCQLSDGRKISAKKIAEHEQYDMALIQLEGLGDAPATLTALKWLDDGQKPDAGCFVATVAENESPVAMGIVTVAQRQFRVREGGGNNNRAYLGVQAEGQDGKLVLARVLPDTAASRAGLKDGDVLSSVNKETVASQDELISLLGKFKPEETIELIIQREDKEMKITAKLGRNATSNSGVDRWGGGPFTESEQKRFGYPTVLAHDTVIRPEYCGTPLVNTNGQIVGINISRALRVATYAVPADEIVKFLKNHSQKSEAK
jgi:serine protease Do